VRQAAPAPTAHWAQCNGRVRPFATRRDGRTHVSTRPAGISLLVSISALQFNYNDYVNILVKVVTYDGSVRCFNDVLSKLILSFVVWTVILRVCTRFKTFLVI